VSESAPPEGLVYRPDVLAPEEERALLDVLAGLRFDPIVIRGHAAKRTARHYGLDYDYESRTPRPGEPVPDWLHVARDRAAALAEVEPEELVEIDGLAACLSDGPAPALNAVLWRLLALDDVACARVLQEQEGGRACEQISRYLSGDGLGALGQTRGNERFEGWGAEDKGAEVGRPREIVANAMPW